MPTDDDQPEINPPPFTEGPTEDERVEDAGLDYEDTSETVETVMPQVAA